MDDITSTNPIAKYAFDQQSRSQIHHVSKEKVKRFCTLVMFGHTYMHHMSIHSPRLTLGFLHIRVVLLFLGMDGWIMGNIRSLPCAKLLSKEGLERSQKNIELGK